MSSHKLVVAPEARQDLQDVLRATRRAWGEQQRAVYARLLRNAMEQLTQYPELGKPSFDLAPRLRSYRIQHHVIYYRIDDQTINVVRLLHVRMDAAATFADEVEVLPPSAIVNELTLPAPQLDRIAIEEPDTGK